MAKIKLFTRNILETGTVEVTGEPDSGYPEARLYDRDGTLYWKDTVTEAKTFKVDQGASNNKSIDLLAIIGHNFDGEDLTWEYSEDDSNWYDAVVGWSQSGNSQIIKTLAAALTKRYWRVTLSSMPSPRCAEMFMSYGYEFQVDFNNPVSVQKKSYVLWQETASGIDRSVKQGDRRRMRSYPLFLDSTTRENLRDALDDLDELSKSFFIKDHEDNYFLCRLLEDPLENFMTEEHTPLLLDIIEQLTV